MTTAPLYELTQEELTDIANASLESLIRDIDSSTSGDEGLDFTSLSTEEQVALESLAAMVSDIRATGAISRSDASELMSLTSSLEGFDQTFSSLPLNSFTETPSRVNYQPSMEGVMKDMGRRIMEAIRKVIAYLRSKVRGNKVKSAQIAAACVKVSKEHTPLSEPAITKAATEAVVKKEATPPPMVAKVIQHAKKAQPESPKAAIAEAVKAVTNDVEKQIPDLYILFYTEDYFSKLNADYERLIKASGQVCRDFNASSYLDVVDDVLSKYMKEPMSPDVAMTGELGKAGGDDKMLKSASIVRSALGESQRRISAKGRSFELIKKNDVFTVVNKISEALNGKGKAALKDMDGITGEVLNQIEKGIKQLETATSREQGEKKTLSQEKLYLLDIAKDVTMFGWNGHDALVTHVGKMAKIGHHNRI